MKILAVTCYTGGEDLVKMTESCIASLRECVPSGVDFCVSVLCQGSNLMGMEGVDSLAFEPSNVGFAFGMNKAIETGADYWNDDRSSFAGDPDFVLCFNNDLKFPHKDWLKHLTDIAAKQPNQVLSPMTDRAANLVAKGPASRPSFPVQESSAYCWLIPFAWCRHLKEKYGFWLFSEDFAPAYGEDNWTAYLLSKAYGTRAFRMVPRSFVRHLRAKTSSTVKLNRKASNKTLVAKFTAELNDSKLRPDLRRWAISYIRILSRRI